MGTLEALGLARDHNTRGVMRSEPATSPRRCSPSPIHDRTAAVIGMLQTAGFTRAAVVYEWLAPVRPGAPAAQGNAIFHAWRDAGEVPWR